ncbi:MAG: hypothetical protein FJX65_05220 [Alphaproteobacteria bacterium]|nr:hypothetical protein [Alphaproteobacteria bacterium]
MPQWLETVRGWIGQLITIMIALIPLALVLQVLFGLNTPFLGGAIVKNLLTLITELGGAGLVGLIGLVIIIYLFNAATRR